ncbi:hypothetical protein F8154_11480 [Alkaliphilus pronyensis]|uniref:Uncharacterized protein n=1 Tax=Alkaliphilus pronyensis TaxID=1482732 RepID=A0A6I0F9B0_9FIRM|nr:hypothetical protein [Alkaliphilus pronyensis]KAB3532762.1 hypothetical protein F8154_11480 [Alkaliphilus pronyensis]
MAILFFGAALIFDGINKLLSSNPFSESRTVNVLCSIVAFYLFLNQTFMKNIFNEFNVFSILSLLAIALILLNMYGFYKILSTKKISVPGIQKSYIVEFIESALKGYRIEYNKVEEFSDVKYILHNSKSLISVNSSFVGSNINVTFKKTHAIPYFDEITYDLVEFINEKNKGRPMYKEVLTILGGFVTIIAGAYIYYRLYI